MFRLRPQSLRVQLLLRLSWPLVFVVSVDAIVSYRVALHFTDSAYDRWLLDSARSLAQQVKTHKDTIVLDLPPSAIEVFRWDDIDKTFFKVESEQAGFLAGDRALPTPPLTRLFKEQPTYTDETFQGQRIRVVSVLTEPAAQIATRRKPVTESAPVEPAPAGRGAVLVAVAETLNKRRDMTEEILLAVLLPQLLLVSITFLHIWTGVNRGLQPLRDLARSLGQRSARELSPIPDAGVPLEVRSLTDTINALLQRLGSAMATQRRFIENAAHQLRTPLAGLKIQAERALRTGDSALIEPALTHIKHSADRVSRLSSQLLVLARSESMSLGLREFGKVDLTALVRDCCMEWAPLALEQGIELGFEGPPRRVRCLGDPMLLRELLNNLIDNAIRYGGSGGQIGVKLESEPELKMIVEDDGPGIPPGEVERVFERFYRIAGSSGEGCGLGLAIVREIADLHDAQVRILPGAALRGTRIEVVFGADESPDLAGVPKSR